MMAWEHSLLGDLDPALVQAAAFGRRSTRALRALMSGAFRQLGRPVEEGR